MTSRNPNGRPIKYQPGEPRVCDGCGQTFPFTAEYFYKDGGRLRNRCIPCGKERHKARAQRHKQATRRPVVTAPGTVLVIRAEYHDGQLAAVKYDIANDKLTLDKLLEGLKAQAEKPSAANERAA